MELRESIEAFKARKISWWELDPDIITIILNAVEVGTLIPADAVFQVREGYRVSSRLGAYMDVPLSEALTIRSADDVRREGFRDGVLSSAVLAEGRYQQWHEGCGVECDASVCADIAVGIRALAEQKGE